VKTNLNLEELSFQFFQILNNLQQSSLGPYLKIIFFVFFAFFIVLVLARTRKLLVKSSFHGLHYGIIIGILIMLVVDLIIIVGLSDKDKLQKITSGEAGPEIVKEIAFSGMTNLSQVLGAQTIIAPRKVMTAQELINDFLGLPDEEATKVRDLLCPPD
jgi:hypothetical protein